MRAALYARVSTEEQTEGYSIEAQLRACRTLAQDKGWTVLAEYIDEGKSARSEDISKRPKFKEMLEAAKRREFDVLVVHKLDRFARNLLTMLKCFDELSQSGITFISVSEQIDYTTPMGRVFLAMSGAFAQFYSDNLSQETKKGWHERKLQGLYCGALPFGAMKGNDDIPVPDTQERRITIDGQEVTLRNYEGLKLAFDLAAKGKSDRQVAITLNAAGYRTTGTHGSRPFSKDTVKDMLNNKFYIGLLPDGNGGWLKAKHELLVEQEAFEETQKMRVRRMTRPQTIRSDAHVYSLSGIGRCAECSSTLRAFKGRGRVRLACNGRLKDANCSQPSAALDIYEQQLLGYLKAFHIPDDYQEKILEAHRKLQSACDVERQRSTLQTRLERIKELYEWGHKTKEQYLADYVDIQRELQQLPPDQPHEGEVLEKIASFLKDVSVAWEQATQEQRNRLASCLFEAVWIRDKKVLAVTPRSEFKPFFDLQYDGMSNYVLQIRPRGGSGHPIPVGKGCLDARKMSSRTSMDCCRSLAAL